MPINPYTQQIIKERPIQRLDDPNAVQAAGVTAQGVSEAMDQVGGYMQERASRVDTINRARDMSKYNQEMQSEYIKFEQERDLTDPKTVQEYNQLVRRKQAEYVAKHEGSGQSRATLETQLIGLQDQYTTKMTQKATMAQKAFINDTVGGHINDLSKQVYDNPDSLDSVFAQLDGVFEEFGPAMDAEDELDMREIAQMQIAENSLNSLIDQGNYNQAKDLVDNNPAYVQALDPTRQASVLSRINNGIMAQEKQKNELKNKVNSIRGVAQELGVEVSGTQIFGAATGIQAQETPQAKIDTFSQVLGQDPSELTPSVIAKIGFGVDLPSASEIDYNKERAPDGGFTPKGIGAQIKKPYDDAANAKILVDKVLMQADEFVETDNKQAGLAAMISFQKLIDDGAAVREGDIKLSAQGVSALDNMSLMLKRIGKGAIATPEQIAEMRRSAEIFGNSVIEGSKTFIDPFIDDGLSRGYRMIDMGLPQQAYDGVYGAVKTTEDRKQNTDKLQSFADQYYNGDIEIMLQDQAKQQGLTVEQVKKDMGYTK